MVVETLMLVEVVMDDARYSDSSGSGSSSSSSSSGSGSGSDGGSSDDKVEVWWNSLTQ